VEAKPRASGQERKEATAEQGMEEPTLAAKIDLTTAGQPRLKVSAAPPPKKD
jgi:hypothetical protein